MHEKNNPDHSITQFTDKYTKTGKVGNLLVRNFFKTIKQLSPSDATSVLEVGCGAGYSMEELRTFFKPTTTFSASDIDPELVRLAKEKNPTVDCQTASIYALPYADHSFDCIFCLEVLEHLEHPEKALAELARVSKKYVIASTPREPIWRMLNMMRGKYLRDFGNTHGHINHWSSRTLRNLVARYFDIVEVAKPLPWTMIYGKTKSTR
jgi:ubiquinone/menaquinone biosynthesis C-methylase UbiE